MALANPRKIKINSFGFPLPAAGRLTLASAVPVLTSDQTAKTAVLWTPYQGSTIPLWTGSQWAGALFPEQTLNLASNSGYTNYHQSGKNFDVFAAIDSGGTTRFGSGPSWAAGTAGSDVVRGTSTGSTELQMVNGIWTNKNSMTLRIGANSGDTVTVPANQGVYLGSFRTSADGQTQVKFGTLAASGGEAWIGLWNQYNRTPFSANVRDSTDSWTYSTATWRAANNSSTIRCSFISGQAEDDYQSLYNIAASATGSVQISIGLDGATFDNKAVGGYTNAANIMPMTSSRRDIGLLGFHFLEAIEYANTGTTTFYGDANSPTFIQNGLLVSGRY